MTLRGSSALAALVFVIAACDEEGANPGTDSGADLGGADLSEDAADVGTADQDTGPDLAGPDLGAADADASCDPAALVAEGFGFVDSVNDATVTIDESDGIYTATIDASAGGSPATAADHAFVYIDLDAGQPVAIDDYESLDDSTWDLAFKRAEIRLNSGDSGPGPWLVAVVDDTSFETVAPPGAGEGGYTSDSFVSDSCELETFGQGDPATAFGQWYSYDPSTHTLGVVEGRVYVLYDAGSHGVVKLEIVSWDNGTYELRWAPLT